MFSKIRIILLIVSIFLVYSCNNGTDFDCINYSTGIIDVEIPDTVNINQEYEVEVSYGAPNLCYEFKELNTKLDNNKLILNAAICKNQKPNTACPQSPLYGEVSTTIVFNRTGDFSIVINDGSLYKTVWAE